VLIIQSIRLNHRVSVLLAFQGKFSFTAMKSLSRSAMIFFKHYHFIRADMDFADYLPQSSESIEKVAIKTVF
jgi:hypothetical protein